MIRALREQQNLTQAELAHKLMVSQQAVAKWENGEALPTANKLPELARILGCTIDDLFAKDQM